MYATNDVYVDATMSPCQALSQPSLMHMRDLKILPAVAADGTKWQFCFTIDDRPKFNELRLDA